MSIPLPIYIKEPIAVFFDRLSFGSVPVAWNYAATVFAKDYGLPKDKSVRIHRKYHHYLRKWLTKRYGHIAECELPEGSSQTRANEPIWVFWWQGEQKAPELVQLCIQSIIRNSAGHPVVVVSEDNYRSYAELPDYITEKREKGIISLTHFSDILRMSLLSKYGGLWLDATIFVSEPIPDRWFTDAIYTGRNPGGDHTNASDWNWTSYALATSAGHSLPMRMKNFFLEYWKNENGVVDYFMMDTAIDMIVRKCDGIRAQIYAIPNNNTRQHDLDAMFYRPYDKEAYESLLYNSDTCFHKLTWKASYPLQTENGEETAYSYWRNQMLK